MKKKITAIAIAGLAIIAFAIGCSDKELQGQYQQTIVQMAAQADSIKALHAAVQSKSDSLTLAMQSVSSVEARVDSISQKYQKASNSVASLSNKVKGLTKEFNSLQEDCSRREGELLSGIRERDSVLTVIDALFSDTNVTLTSVRGELGDERARTQWHADLLAKIKPWYKKWKHDSNRSFLKVLFAAGKAKKPDFEEPNLDSLMPPTGRIQQIVPADTTKIEDISMREDVGRLDL